MQERFRQPRFALVLGVLLAAAATASADNWPRFRGPNGTGVAADKGIPVKWGAGDVLWKVELPGVGHSSPVVWGDRLFLQTSGAKGDGRALLCLDANTGKQLWSRAAPGGTATRIHRAFNTLASSTPATDGERVYAVFWDGKDVCLSAYDMKGEPLWKRDLGAYISQHGPGMSPVIHAGKVFVNNDQDGSAALLAFDARSGAPAWKAERKAFRACYSTPMVRQKPGGGDELVVASTAGITAYDPKTGAENWAYEWTFTGMALRTVCSPLEAAGLIFVSSGDGSGARHFIAVEPPAKSGERPKLAWSSVSHSFPYVPTIVARDGYIYLIDDNGSFLCHDAKTGDEVWKTPPMRVKFFASPVLIDGKVYAPSMKGDVYVFEAAPKYNLLAKNSLGEEVFASPAVANSRLYVRGKQHLFCVGRPAPQRSAEAK
jgi:outer membrane protein assembly factor BamB